MASAQQILDNENKPSIFEPIKNYVSQQTLGYTYKTIDPEFGVQFGYGSVIRFRIPAEGLLYPNSLAMFFNLQVRSFLPTTAAGRSLALPNDAGSIFQYCRLLLGRTHVIDEIREFGPLNSYMADVQEPLESYTGSGYLKGIGLETNVTNLTQGAALRGNYLNAAVNSTNNFPGWNLKRLYFKPRMGFFQSQKPLPLHLLGSQLYLEFKLFDSFFKMMYFPQSNNSTTQPSMDILDLSRPQLRYKIEITNPTLDKQLIQAMRRQELQYQWDGVFYDQQNLSLNNQNQLLSYRPNKKRVKSALAVIRCDADITVGNFSQSPTNTYACLDPRDLSTANFDNVRRTALRNYQWNFNNFAFPEYPVHVFQLMPQYATAPAGISSNAAWPITFDANSTLTCSAADAYYYFEEIYGSNLGPNKDGMWGMVDTLATATAAAKTIANLPTSATADNGTIPAKLYMAAKFAYRSCQGDVLYAINTKDSNAPLQLRLAFNGLPRASETGGTWTGPPPAMTVDAWITYDKVFTLQENGVFILDE